MLSLRSSVSRRLIHSSTRALSPCYTTFDPNTLSGKNPITLQNLVGGKWTPTTSYTNIPDPMKDGEIIVHAPETSEAELTPFIESINSCPKTGLHNPFKNVDRYVMLGEVSHKAANMLGRDADFFARAIMRVMPKSYAQALGEVKVTQQFLKNFAGDNVRFLARDFGVTGDHDGQHSTGYRWPFGPVAIIAPFNFPLEIPVLQMMGALYMGNKPVVKGTSSVSLVIEMFVRLLHACGLPTTDLDLIHCSGPRAQQLLERSNIRLTQFTGSSQVAEKLAVVTGGKVRVEDAGFDWKILGPDGANDERTLQYVAWQSDQDAYACSGQKCSAQSILFAHTNWVKAGLLDRIKKLAEQRNVNDLTVGAVLSETTQRMLSHQARLLQIPGARVLFGGKELSNHTIFKGYGALEPTAVFVPLKAMLANEADFKAATTEIFGPFQVVVEYDDSTLPLVLQACERMSHHLTAAVVSNDVLFQRKVLAHTVNGTTYAGLRARTTGAPQNHWFGPAGDPRGAGIGSPEAIKLVWSCHREIIQDVGPIPSTWKQPQQS